MNEQQDRKRCIKCNEIKPISDFEKRKDTGKHRNVCKQCVNKQHNIYLHAHPEIGLKQKEKRIKDKSRHVAYFEGNKDKIFSGEKECNVCHKIKPLTEFYYRSDEERFWSYCKSCKAEKQRRYDIANSDIVRKRRKAYRERTKDHISAHMKQYWREHRDERLAYQKKRYENNKEEILAKNREYYEANRDKIYSRSKPRRKRWFNENKETIYKHIRDRKEADPIYKMREQIRVLIRNSIRKKGYRKGSRTYEILGCDYDTFMVHLLATFKENYGYDWNGEPYHIDHIKPIASARSEDEVVALCHYSNLQMLKPEDNMSKGDNEEWKLNISQ